MNIRSNTAEGTRRDSGSTVMSVQQPGELNLINDPSLTALPIHLISEGYALSIERISRPHTTSSLQTILHQAPQNHVAATGAALGFSILDSILPSLSQHQAMRVPLAQFSSQLEAVLLRNSALNAPQLIAFAENAVALLRAVLPVVKELKITPATQMPDSSFIELPNASSLRKSGYILAELITGTACRQAPLSQILQSAAFAEVLSTFSLVSAAPFAGSAAGAANFVYSAAFTGALLIGFMTHLPEFLMKSNLDGSRLSDLIEALPARWFLLSFTVTAVTMTLMIAVSRNEIEIDHVESTSDDAMSDLMNQTLTNCEQMITAVAQATEAAGLRSVLYQNGFLPPVNPRIATGLQGIMQRILGIIGKITEDSRRLLLFTEGI